MTRGVGVGSYEPDKSGGSGLMGLQVTLSLAMGGKGSGLMELKYFERIAPNSARPVRELEAGSDSFAPASVGGKAGASESGEHSGRATSLAKNRAAACARRVQASAAAWSATAERHRAP